MKTPRDILIERHRHIEPQLDAIRRRALAGLTSSQAGLLSKVWMELIWPCRHAWGALAATWVVVLAVNLQMKVTVAPVPTPPSVAQREMARTLEEQRRFLAELLESGTAPRTMHSRPAPQPRSERLSTFRDC